MRHIIIGIENNKPRKTYIMRDGKLKVYSAKSTERHYNKLISAVLKMNWTGSGDPYCVEYTVYSNKEWER